MNNTGNITEQQYQRHACVLAVVTAGILAVLRTALTPTAFEQPLPYGIVIGVVGVWLVVLLVLSALKHTLPITVGGRMAQVSAAGAAVAGAAFAVFSGFTAYKWIVWGDTPYPSRIAVSALDQLFVWWLIAFGAISGVLFLFLAAHWWRLKSATYRHMPLFMLVPVFWTWIRLIRYITSHVSSLGLFRNVYDLSMVVFEMLFFLLLARHLSGIGEKSSRFFFGVSLCTGLLCTISSITRVALFLGQDRSAFDTCALVTTPDFGVAVLAFSIAFAQSFGTECNKEDVEELEEDSDDIFGGGAEYLISDAWVSVYDPEDMADS